MQIGPFYPLGYNSASNLLWSKSYSTLTDSTQYLTFAHRTYMPRIKRFLGMRFEIVDFQDIFSYNIKRIRERIRTLPDPPAMAAAVSASIELLLRAQVRGARMHIFLANLILLVICYLVSQMTFFIETHFMAHILGV